MVSPSQALTAIPSGLRDPLLEEYRLILQNYLERKWLPAELSGGRFCEIVYTILTGYAAGTYPASPNKPANFLDACRRLENYTSVPRSFQILIPRLLPALYEIRNQRGVGHVGGDVDPNLMDSIAVVSMVNWIMAELIRVYHQLSTDEAQRVIDILVERRVPLVWQIGQMKRVLDPSLSLRDQALLLIYASSTPTTMNDLVTWIGVKEPGYFKRILRDLHTNRYIELSSNEEIIEILPPGTKYVEESLLPSINK